MKIPKGKTVYIKGGKYKDDIPDGKMPKGINIDAPKPAKPKKPKSD